MRVLTLCCSFQHAHIVQLLTGSLQSVQRFTQDHRQRDLGQVLGNELPDDFPDGYTMVLREHGWQLGSRVGVSDHRQFLEAISLLNHLGLLLDPLRVQLFSNLPSTQPHLTG